MRNFLLLIVIIVFCYCGRQNKKIVENANLEVIDIFSEPSSVISNLSDIASNVEYVPLQTSENSMVSLISNVKTNGDIIIVYSFSFNKSELICFDRNGRYLKKLSKNGRGPGEYFVIGDYDINFKANILVLLSDNIIILYDIIGNEFVYNKSLNFKSTYYYNQTREINFIPGQNNILLSYSSTTFEKFRYLVINLNGDTLDTRLNYYKFKTDPIQGKKLTLGAPWVNIGYNYNNSLHFKDWFSDTVFTIDHLNNIIPYFRFDSNGKQFNPDDLAELYILNQTRGSSYPEDYVIVNFVMESPQYIVYNYRYKKATIYELYDKVLNKKIGISTKPFLEDDITGGLNVEPQLSFDGKLYSWVEAIDLKKHVSSEEFKNSDVKYPKKKEALETLANSLKETDNPVVIVVTLKQ